MKNFLKTAGKWTLIMVGFALLASWLGDLPFESRVNLFLFGLGFAIAYTEGSLRDRIKSLEYRVDEQDRRLRRHD